MEKIIKVSALAVLLILPILSLAAPAAEGGFGGSTGTDSNHSGKLPNLLRVDSAEDLINKIIDGLLLLAAPIVTIMVLVGAYQIMFAGGNSEKWQTGKKTIIYAVVGYAIILISKGVALIIQDFFR